MYVYYYDYKRWEWECAYKRSQSIGTEAVALKDVVLFIAASESFKVWVTMVLYWHCSAIQQPPCYKSDGDGKNCPRIKHGECDTVTVVCARCARPKCANICHLCSFTRSILCQNYHVISKRSRRSRELHTKSSVCEMCRSACTQLYVCVIITSYNITYDCTLVRNVFS